MNNSVWESRLPLHFKKPSPSATHAVRDRYIRDKYELKKYLDTSGCTNVQGEGGGGGECVPQYTRDLIRACEINDVSLLFQCIALGGPESIISTSGAFPLHVAARRDASACCMLLLVSGSDVLEKDSNDLTASEVANMAGHTDLSTFLFEREEHALAATKSRRNSDTSRTSDNASQEDSNSLHKMTPNTNLNHEFDDIEMQQSMQDMVSKALSSSEEDMEGLDGGSGSGSRVPTTEDITE